MTAIAELERIAASTIRPTGRHTVTLVVDVTPGGRLANGSPSGIGVVTRYGPAWFDGLRKSAPIALFERAKDARLLADILDGRPALRSAPHSVATLTSGPAERGAVQTAEAHPRRSVPGGRRRAPADPKASTSLPGVPVEQDAGLEPGSTLDLPAAGLCAACGISLEGLPASRTGHRRKTCGDACRKAYQRGHRAPVPGVVAPEAVAALSRLPRRFLSGFGHGDPDRRPDPAQLALSADTPA